MSASSLSPLRAELARKALHLLTAALPIAWARDVVSTSQLRGALTAALVVALGIEVLRRRSPAIGTRFVALVGPLLRRHETRALTGATWLALAMAAAVWFAPERAALAALWAAAVGDASAAVVGRSVAQWRGLTTGGKSWVGSAAAALSTAVGCWWLAAATWPVAVALGAVAAMAEYPHRPFDDNLRVATAVALAAVVLGLR
ncbi:MAG: hypothetical protein C0503_01400 [Gemmatimonas sp.]|nr:hypothetical protein [Gemmatimonas sp.]